MGLRSLAFTAALSLAPLPLLMAQGTLPTFQHKFGAHEMTLLGRNPARGGTTTIPVELYALRLSFAGTKTSQGAPFVLDASGDVARIEQSPIFSHYKFPSGGDTQYLDAMLRSTVPGAGSWHTLLARPTVHHLALTVPSSQGYVLNSKRTGGVAAVANIQYLQKAILQKIPSYPGALVLVVAPNTAYYNGVGGCCSWGTHGVDAVTGNTFVIAAYLNRPPGIVTDRDVQPITTQLAELANDPGVNRPSFRPRPNAPGNKVAPWRLPAGAHGCGRGLFLEPGNHGLHGDFGASAAYAANAGGRVYHLDNVALMGWYAGVPSSQYSFPEAGALTRPAQPCPMSRFFGQQSTPPPAPTATALPENGTNGHALIGYWEGYGTARQTFPLRDISPQWDYVLVAFAPPAKNAPEGTFHFAPPTGTTPAEFKAGVAALKREGKKVMISLGGGGQTVKLDTPASVTRFEDSVTRIVSTYGFEGVDIDFEAPSMEIQPGDTDFRHPTTPSIVNLIAALKELRQHFGPGFLISLVPEGAQIPGGYVTYGGEWGAYLPLVYGLRHILTFVDVQNYNTPPLEGLDGNIYQLGSMDYYTAMVELMLHGFDVDHNPALAFPAVPADKVAIGYITGENIGQIRDAMSYLITGKKPAGAKYTLRNPNGYPGLLGAMLWTINGDRRGNYDFSNVIGPELHHFAQHGAKQAALTR